MTRSSLPATPTDPRRDVDVMRAELDTIPGMMAEQLHRLRPPIQEAVARLAIVDVGVPEIVITGCGDSHFAGVGARLAFERGAGVRARATEALEFARYEVRYVPLRPAAPLLLAVSYSGEVGRTIEATATARRFGWHTIALTSDPSRRLALTAEQSILMEVPTLGFSPGTSTYIAMLMALYMVAAEIARVSGRESQASWIDGNLARAPALARQTLEDSETRARDAAGIWARGKPSTFIGAGPSRATAAFGAAKLFEGPHRYGVAQDLEEWAHEQYFVSGPKSPVTIIAPSGASLDRAAELLSEMSLLGVPSVLVTDEVSSDAVANAKLCLPVARGLEEPFSPLLTALPVALSAFFLAKAVGARSYGFRSPEHEREHYETIHRATHREPA